MSLGTTTVKIMKGSNIWLSLRHYHVIHQPYEYSESYPKVHFYYSVQPLHCGRGKSAHHHCQKMMMNLWSNFQIKTTTITAAAAAAAAIQQQC
jgi:beta-glucanase (GH16 family)